MKRPDFSPDGCCSINDGLNCDHTKIEDLIGNSNSWSLDVWSLGTILLEIISGFPVWMDLKAKATLTSNKIRLGKGLFSV